MLYSFMVKFYTIGEEGYTIDKGYAIKNNDESYLDFVKRFIYWYVEDEAYMKIAELELKEIPPTQATSNNIFITETEGIIC